MSSSTYRLFRRKLSLAGLVPSTGLGRFTLYVLVLDLLLFCVEKLVQAAGRSVSALSGWTTFLTIILAVLLVIVSARWASRVLLWRLRNRLFVTYVFIGVIPLVLVVSIFLIAGYLFAGQFATYTATSAIESEVAELRSDSDLAARELGSQFAATPGKKEAQISATASLLRRFPDAEIAAWYDGEPVSIAGTPAPTFTLPPKISRDTTGETSEAKRLPGFVLDQGRPFLRAFARQTVRDKPLLVVTSVPVSAPLLEHIASGLGEVGFYQLPGITVTETPEGTAGKQQTTISTRGTQNLKTIAVAGSLPAASGGWDRTLDYGIIIRALDWNTGRRIAPVLKVRTRPSSLYQRLFSNLGELANVAIFLLIAIAVVFAIIEFVALLIGVGLTRTITGAVAKLYDATQHINRGDLKHRIKVRSRDQLAALETSFNSMSDSLERLLAEQREKERLQNELAIAQEVQAQLFPRQEAKFESLELHGICRPARVVSGDYYDFLPLGAEKLALAVGDISGKGISAALLMATIHSAVRAYEFGRVPAPAEMITVGAAAVAAARAGAESQPMLPPSAIESPANVLWLLNRHLYHSTPAEKYATLFLGLYDGATRTLTYANGGHLPPIIIGQDGTVRRLTCSGLVIGLFDNITHDEDSIQLRPGDIFLAYSDGVTEPENEFGEFGEERLVQIVVENRGLPLARISEEVLSAVQAWIGGAEQPDDVTVVLARAS